MHFFTLGYASGANNDPSIEIVRQNKKKSAAKNEVKSIKDIPKAFPIDLRLLYKSPKLKLEAKDHALPQPFITRKILVLMPYAGQCGISRKIEDKAERARLKRIIANLSLREGMGLSFELRTKQA